MMRKSFLFSGLLGALVMAPVTILGGERTLTASHEQLQTRMRGHAFENAHANQAFSIFKGFENNKDRPEQANQKIEELIRFHQGDINPKGKQASADYLLSVLQTGHESRRSALYKPFNSDGEADRIPDAKFIDRLRLSGFAPYFAEGRTRGYFDKKLRRFGVGKGTTGRELFEKMLVDAIAQYRVKVAVYERGNYRNKEKLRARIDELSEKIGALKLLMRTMRLYEESKSRAPAAYESQRPQVYGVRGRTKTIPLGPARLPAPLSSRAGNAQAGR